VSGDRIPVAVRSETLSIAGVPIEVHVLDDGRRIVSTESLQSFFALLETADLGGPDIFGEDDE
jgi:hypothetical protein